MRRDKSRLYVSILKNPSNIFYGILLLHLILWTITPLITRYTVSHDVIEAFVWAQQLDWGYDKNPWLVGWLARLGIIFGAGKTAAGYYFLQQLFICLGLWSVWKLGQKFFNPSLALIAALVLEGYLNYTVYVSINNDNFALFGLWSLSLYLFYLAVSTQWIRYWILTGIFLALTMMTKYSASFLILFMSIYLLVNHQARQSFFKPGIYFGTLIGILICVPNIIWLFHHQFVSLKYSSDRTIITIGSDFFTRHFYYPLQFLKDLFSNSAACFILFALAYPFSRNKSRDRNIAQFLWILGVCPLLFIVVVGSIKSWQLYSEWADPMLWFLGLILVYYIQPSISKNSLRRFLIGVIVILFLGAGINYLISGVLTAGKGSADYPAKQVATYVTDLWHSKYHTPLKYVAGSRYMAGYVSFYSKDKPKVFAEWNLEYSPGVSLEDLKKHGAVFVHDGYFGTMVVDTSDFATRHRFPKTILKRFLNLIVFPEKTFQYNRNEKTHETENLIIGILPPEKSK